MKNFLPNFTFSCFIIACYFSLPTEKTYWMLVICPSAYFVIYWLFSKFQHLLPDDQAQ
ncbi:MAG: hypothetical protein KBT36_10380 [Kurthia sp.]|nr:hypothetical protein [Candidatus Kurthia equi]